MISFYAKMYNVTTESYYDSQPILYTIGYYHGNGIGIGDDGTTKTDLPLTDFDLQYSSNVGTHFEFYAKEYFIQNNVWPVLRLCTSNSTTDYYLEWDSSDVTGFNIKSPGKYTRWASSFQFDPTNLDLSHQDYSNVFVSVPDIGSLDTLAIIWSGAVKATDQDVETLVSYATVNVSVSNEAYLRNGAGTVLGTVTDREFVKTYDGPAIYAYLIGAESPNNFGWHGVGGFYPCASLSDPTPIPPFNPSFSYNGPYSTGTFFEFEGIAWRTLHDYFIQTTDAWTSNVPVHTGQYGPENLPEILLAAGVEVTLTKQNLYEYLQGQFTPVDPVPPTDVDPDNPPDPSEEPDPIPPDDQDPYYDPTSDPDNPDYDPTKDPGSPSYDPAQPSTPYRPPSTEGGGNPLVQPPQDPISTPETPPSYVTTNAMFTLYNPSGGDLTNLANFLWSPTWSIDTFKKIFANPLDCILGLMVMPHLNASVGTKVMNVGNISTGVTMHYFTSQFYDFDCGTFKLEEYYASYLDYAPYTRVNIFLPYIGDKQLSTDEVMNKTLGVKYRFDLATGDCVAFITVEGSVLYSFSGNCAARLPLAGNNWNGIIPALTGVAISAGSMAAGLPALGAASAAAVSTMKETISHTGNISGSAGLMGIQTPYLIVTRPRQALPISQNSFTGYPSFMTESLGSLTGYTEVEQCHLEHVPATGAELEEIERLLKEGVLF